MPSLIDEELEKVELPSVPGKPQLDGAWVVIDTSPIRADDTDSVDTGITRGGASIRLLAQRIKEWNFTDPDGSVTPITYQSVGKLHIDHYSFLYNKIQTIDGNLSVDEKKDLSPTSVQSIPVTTLE